MKLIVCLVFESIFICCLCSRGKAQSRGTADTLWMLTTYMKEVQAAIPEKGEDTAAKMKLLHHAIAKGTENKYLLQRQLARVPVDSSAAQQVIRQYNFLLQSAALLRSSLTQVPFQDAAVQEEVRYLHRHLPPFIHTLYFYSRRASRMAGQQ